MNKNKLHFKDPKQFEYLKQRVREEIDEYINCGDFEDGYAGDIIHEIVDTCIPVYNTDLLNIARSKLELAIVEPEVYGFNGEHTAINAIAGNLFEELRAVAWEHYNKIKGEMKA